MYWNHRVVKFSHESGDTYTVCEVYYEDDMPVMYAVDCNVLRGDNLDDLKSIHRRVERALEKPVLDGKIFEKEE